MRERVFAGGRGWGCGGVRACRRAKLFNADRRRRRRPTLAVPLVIHQHCTVRGCKFPIPSLFRRWKVFSFFFATLRLRLLRRPLMSHPHSRHRGLPPPQLLQASSALPYPEPPDVGCGGDLSAPITNGNISERSTARATLGPTRHVAAA